MSLNFWLTEEQFNKINPLLPNKPCGVPLVDDRRVLSGIIFCLQHSYRWSDAPAEHGPAKTLQIVTGAGRRPVFSSGSLKRWPTTAPTHAR